MKACPTCNRTYADDTFTFCLNDGALLSAPYDPKATLILPSRRTNQPPVENVIPSVENVVPSAAASDTELPVTVAALPLSAGMVDGTETTGPAEVEGMSGAMIMTIVLLIFGALVMAAFISRC
jgi:hypothetical protein